MSVGGMRLFNNFFGNYFRRKKKTKMKLLFRETALIEALFMDRQTGRQVQADWQTGRQTWWTEADRQARQTDRGRKIRQAGRAAG
jgi:hypothetical protein